MPPASWSWSAAPDPASIGGFELQNPAPNALVVNIQSAFGEKVLDIAAAQSETAVQPNRMLDNLGRKAVAFVRNPSHPSRLLRQVRRGQ